jgi:hypothetical protein
MSTKINIWQLGYTNLDDFNYSNKQNAVCRDAGFVMIDNLEDLWEEEVWHLLNWSCWNYNDEGNAVKPSSVHSYLDHCNSDIILNIDGTDIFKYALSVGFGEATSLEEAVNKSKTGFCNYWPFDSAR